MSLIKTTRHDTVIVESPAGRSYQETPAVLTAAGFAKVKFTGQPGEVTAVHRSATLRGTIVIRVTDLPVATTGQVGARIDITAKADADNVFAIAGNPAAKIIEKYKAALGTASAQETRTFW